MKFAIIAPGDDGDGRRQVHLDALSKIDTTDLSVHVTVMAVDKSPLRALEIASTFDGLIIVDLACMGEEQGTARIFDLNDLVLGDPSRPVALLGFDIDSELLFAHKYLGLPRTKIVAIEKELCGDIARYQEVIRQALEQLIG